MHCITLVESACTKKCCYGIYGVGTVFHCNGAGEEDQYCYEDVILAVKLGKMAANMEDPQKETTGKSKRSGMFYSS